MSQIDRPIVLPHAAETVLAFLESIGKPAETALYLKLFRQLPRESFAIIVAEASQLTHAQGVVAGQLRHLSDLGLTAPIVVGLWEPDRAAHAAERLSAALVEAGLQTRLFDAAAVSISEIVDDIRAFRTPVLTFNDLALDTESRFECLRELATEVDTRKLVFLRPRGGLGPHGVSRLILGPGHVLPCHRGGISVVNLRTDLEALLACEQLPPDDRALLQSIAGLLEAPCSFLASVTAPLGLLRELFTVKGSGTLVKRGTDVLRADGYAQLDISRLRSLLESSFQGNVIESFFDRRPMAVFLESNYRGAAILEDSAVAPVLSKFAVDPVAQGEGVGRDLWQAMARQFDSVIWRARPDNPIVPWYTTQCDGMIRGEKWLAFWRNIDPRDVPAVVAELNTRPEDIRRTP